MHQQGLDARQAGAAMRLSLSRFPLADLDAAERQFRLYAADERNLKAEFILVEKEVRITLPPPEGDEEEIVIVGTLDQVRKVQGRAVLWDIKTGSPDGVDMLNTACLQLAAYQLGASQLLGMPVRSAGIIRTKDYLKTDRSGNSKPGCVFYEAPWGYGDLAAILASVTTLVSLVRKGQVYAAPGEQACKYCIGVGNCLPRLTELTRRVSLSVASSHSLSSAST